MCDWKPEYWQNISIYSIWKKKTINANDTGSLIIAVILIIQYLGLSGSVSVCMWVQARAYAYEWVFVLLVPLIFNTWCPKSATNKAVYISRTVNRTTFLWRHQIKGFLWSLCGRQDSPQQSWVPLLSDVWGWYCEAQPWRSLSSRPLSQETVTVENSSTSCSVSALGPLLLSPGPFRKIP